MPLNILFLLIACCFSPLCARVLTITDALVDLTFATTDEFINSIPGKKGGCDLVDCDQLEHLAQRCSITPQHTLGGSTGNTIKGLQHLGNPCTLITTVGKDDSGVFYENYLHSLGVRLFLAASSLPTGKCACFVAPNGDRTMRTYLGASIENGLIELTREMFEDVELFHMEGYQLKHNALLRRALELAKARGAKVSLDLSSFEVVQRHKEFIWELLKEKKIDLLFANHEEAFTLTDLPAKEASDLLSRFAEVAVVTMGDKGCYARSHGCAVHCAAYKVSAIDTVGAGDLFISGFLHGFLHKQPLQICACIGSLLASHVIQVVGAEIPEERWAEIDSTLLNMMRNDHAHDCENLLLER
jgi:sugar/nucleoside kinase (ribokinase family)